jgi:hypothetical protein
MRTDFKLELKAGRRPNWLRLIALMCVILIGVAGTAEVCHSHADVSTTSKNSQHNAPGPDHCPLSVAMHSAAPASAHTGAEPVLQIQKVLLDAVEIKRLQQWSLELFSRPPPVASLNA